MKTFWIHFHGEFTDLSEGRTLKQAVERLGLTLADVKAYRIVSPVPASIPQSAIRPPQ